MDHTADDVLSSPGGSAAAPPRRGRLPRPALRTPEERNALAMANKQLVYAALRRMRLSCHWAFEDLAAAGFAGLLRACDLYDETRGLVLGTLADRHIRNAVARELDRQRFVHVPPHRPDQRELQARLQPIQLGELRDASGDLIEVHELGVENAPCETEGGERRAAVEAALARLPRQWAEVLRMRYLSDPPMLMGEAAAAMGVSRPTARRMRDAALAALREQCPELADMIDPAA